MNISLIIAYCIKAFFVLLPIFFGFKVISDIKKEDSKILKIETEIRKKPVISVIWFFNLLMLLAMLGLGLGDFTDNLIDKAAKIESKPEKVAPKDKTMESVAEELAEELNEVFGIF